MSQEPQETKVDLDALFKKARSLAFEGNWEEARKICDDILRKNPDYHEVRVFLGRLYAWDKKYDLARKEMQSVIKAQPDYLDARNALIDVEFWSSNLTRALSICEESLKLFPGNNELLLRRARISVSLENFEEATTTINLILEKDSSHKEALKLLERIRFTERIQSSTQEYKLSLNYRFDNFRREESRYGPWHLGSLELLGKFKFGSIIGRVNYASRDFGSGFKSGTQYEIDFYPVITSGLYAYLNAGYSSSSIFPKYRLGVELFKNLPLSYEISAGIRYLDFSSSSVIIYTGSLGKYYKNYWFSFRPFLTTKDSGLSVSGILLIRNYLKDANNFIGLLLGYGSSPVDLISLEDFERLDSFKIGLEMSRMLTSKLLIRCHVRFEREEYVLEEFGNRFILGIGLEQLILKK